MKIQEYVQKVNEVEFAKNSLIQDGVIRQLAVIGEATKNISSPLRKLHAYIPWEDMAGMRDKLVHHYMGVDMDILWATATTDIPSLKNDIEELIGKM